MDGQRLVQLRQKAGLSQEELARRAGVDQTTVSLLERGVVTDPRGSTLKGLARALGRTVDALLAETTATRT